VLKIKRAFYANNCAYMGIPTDAMNARQSDELLLRNVNQQWLADILATHTTAASKQLKQLICKLIRWELDRKAQGRTSSQAQQAELEWSYKPRTAVLTADFVAAVLVQAAYEATPSNAYDVAQERLARSRAYQPKNVGHFFWDISKYGPLQRTTAPSKCSAGQVLHLLRKQLTSSLCKPVPFDTPDVEGATSSGTVFCWNPGDAVQHTFIGMRMCAFEVGDCKCDFNTACRANADMYFMLNNKCHCRPWLQGNSVLLFRRCLAALSPILEICCMCCRGYTPVVFCRLASGEGGEALQQSGELQPSGSALQPSQTSAQATQATRQPALTDDDNFDSFSACSGEDKDTWHADIYVSLDDVVQLRNSTEGLAFLAGAEAGVPAHEHHCVVLRFQGQLEDVLGTVLQRLGGNTQPDDCQCFVGMRHYSSYAASAQTKTWVRGRRRKQYNQLHYRNRRKQRANVRQSVLATLEQAAGMQAEELAGDMHKFGSMPGSKNAPRVRQVRSFTCKISCTHLTLFSAF
jgi:hypothetical protein